MSNDIKDWGVVFVGDDGYDHLAGGSYKYTYKEALELALDLNKKDLQRYYRIEQKPKSY